MKKTTNKIFAYTNLSKGEADQSIVLDNVTSNILIQGLHFIDSGLRNFSGINRGQMKIQQPLL